MLHIDDAVSVHLALAQLKLEAPPGSARQLLTSARGEVLDQCFPQIHFFPVTHHFELLPPVIAKEK